MFTFRKLALPKASVVFKTLWRFAAERQEIFFRRLQGEPPPWTADAVMANYRFTNAYRVLDRVSQFLLARVIYQGPQLPEEVFFRIMVFKIFNRIDTWELLVRQFGEVSWKAYEFIQYDHTLTEASDRGSRIFSAAYIMPSGKTTFGDGRKHRNYLRLLEQMMAERLPGRLTDCRTMEQAFELLRSFPLIGDFLGYQFLIDLNYSQLLSFSEMDFVAPGPGAKAGLRKCFVDLGDLSPSDAIRWMAECQQENFAALGLTFRDLWGHHLQLIDCQNLLCEVDKYSRVAHPEFNDVGQQGRHRIKQRFEPNQTPLRCWFPPKWKLAASTELRGHEV